MLDALYIGATGMQAQQLQVDTIANNLVNMATPGYKRARVGFTDLMVQEAARLALATRDGDPAMLDGLPRIGAGVGVTGVAKLFDMGDLKRTDSPFDVAILGEGFVEVLMPDGSRAFTRGGTLRIGKDGLLSTQGGQVLKPGIVVPEQATSLIVGPDGHVQAVMSNRAQPVDIGQIELVRFANPQGLMALGDHLYRAGEASGEPIMGRPGEHGLGVLVQGSIETSNVRMVDEMVSLVLAQRAYEASAKVIQASDDMLGMVNGLRK